MALDVSSEEDFKRELEPLAETPLAQSFD